MKSTAMVFICRLLIATFMCLSFQAARADMIGASQVISAHNSQADREAVLSVLSRSEVSGQFQSLGIDPQAAKDRVAAMTDDEVRSLAGKLNTLPAGASGDWGWIVAVIIVAAAIYYYYGWKK